MVSRIKCKTDISSYVAFSRTNSIAFFNHRGRATIALRLSFSMQSTKIGVLLAHLSLQDS